MARGPSPPPQSTWPGQYALRRGSGEIVEKENGQDAVMCSAFHRDYDSTDRLNQTMPPTD